MLSHRCSQETFTVYLFHFMLLELILKKPVKALLKALGSMAIKDKPLTLLSYVAEVFILSVAASVQIYLAQLKPDEKQLKETLLLLGKHLSKLKLVALAIVFGTG